MRKILFFLFIAFAFVACSQDAYETGDSALSYLRADMVDMHVIGKDVKSIVTDDGESLKFSSLHVSDKLARPDTVYRALLYYNKVEGKDIELVSSSIASLLVPTKDSKVKEMHPLTFTSGWVSANGKYVNLCLGLKVGKTDDGNTLQGLDIRLDEVKTDAEDHKHNYLTLLHDQNGMPEYYTETFYFSIPIDEYSKGDELHITVNTYGGEVTRTFRK
ncbi:MAG: NigD-like protein [Prevotella sp.]|nr:NigD-like protein [Prevotella sp.]